MRKNVTSYDPRKPIIVEAFKRQYRCTKVTRLVQVGPDTYEADCLVYAPSTDHHRIGGYDNIGTMSVTLPAARFEKVTG